MDVFSFVLAIVAMSIIAGIIRTTIVTRARTHKSLERHNLDSERYEKAFEERLNKIEDRLANMETLVLEREKERKFDTL